MLKSNFRLQKDPHLCLPHSTSSAKIRKIHYRNEENLIICPKTATKKFQQNMLEPE